MPATVVCPFAARPAKRDIPTTTLSDARTVVMQHVK